MKERRATPRACIDASGDVLPDGWLMPSRCDVLDLTPGGARLDVGSMARELGDEFDFSFDKFRTIRRCKLIWKAASFIGVQFLRKNA